MRTLSTRMLRALSSLNTAAFGAPRACVFRVTASRACTSRRSVHSSTDRHTVYNPYSGKEVGTVPVLNAKDVASAVEVAHAAHLNWREVPLADRQAVVSQLLSHLEQNTDTIGRQLTLQMGKPLIQAQGEVAGTIHRARKMNALAPEALAPDQLESVGGRIRYIDKEPVGVVAVIAPWNYPLMTVVNVLVPAILAGNAVVLKHSPQTPLCGEIFASAFADVVGHGDLVRSVFCSHEVADEHLIGDPRVGFVSFTGSVRGGKQVYQAVAQRRLIDCSLELGGKDAAYVAADADLKTAIPGIVDGAIYNAGQSCCSVERVYVHQSHYDAFLEGALPLVKAYTLGDPLTQTTTLGPMALEGAPEQIEKQVDDAVKKGADLLHGGKPTADPKGNGRFFQPTLLANCDHSMSVMTEETFGPVVAVQAVSGDDEFLSLVNDSQYGLTAGIFTKNTDTAVRLGQRIEVGSVLMNQCDTLDPELPWGGVKNTGKGVSLSKHGFRGVTKLKAFNLKMHQ